MNADTLSRAVQLADSLKRVFIVTADSSGIPHLAIAGRMSAVHGMSVSVASWFCPKTVENMNSNKNVAIIAWDPETDTGYQLIGEVAKMEEVEMVNGFSEKLEHGPHLPQVERKATIRIDKILDFKRGPHSDMVEYVSNER